MIDSAAFRTALGLYATGVTVVTCRHPATGACIGITANSFTSVSLEPPLVSWGLSMGAYSLPAFRDAGHFAVHVLGANQQDLARCFATRGADKFAGLSFKPGLGGAPLFDPVLARFECQVHKEVTAGDHVVFFGQVMRFETWNQTPLLFLSGRFLPVNGAAGGARPGSRPTSPTNHGSSY